MGIIPSPSCPQTAGKKSTMRWERMADEAPPPTLRPSQKTTKRKRRGPHLPGTVRNTIPVWILKLLKGFQILTPPTYSDPPTRSFSDRQLSADRTRTGVPADAGSIRGQYTTFIQHKKTNKHICRHRPNNADVLCLTAFITVADVLLLCWCWSKLLMWDEAAVDPNTMLSTHTTGPLPLSIVTLRVVLVLVLIVTSDQHEVGFFSAGDQALQQLVVWCSEGGSQWVQTLIYCCVLSAVPELTWMGGVDPFSGLMCKPIGLPSPWLSSSWFSAWAGFKTALTLQMIIMKYIYSFFFKCWIPALYSQISLLYGLNT